MTYEIDNSFLLPPKAKRGGRPKLNEADYGFFVIVLQTADRIGVNRAAVYWGVSVTSIHNWRKMLAQ